MTHRNWRKHTYAHRVTSTKDIFSSNQLIAPLQQENNPETSGKYEIQTVLTMTLATKTLAQKC